jgi:hypothetical protein
LIDVGSLIGPVTGSIFSREHAGYSQSWENPQEIRWVLKDVGWDGVAAAGQATIDLEGRLIKDGVRKALCERQNSLGELIDAFRQYRKLADKTPLTL